MKKYFSILFLIAAALLSSCISGQTQNTALSAKEFEAKIKELPTAPIIDVRTPEEFLKGHLMNANNYDWNANDFQKNISKLDKTKPVFVYCLSGGRSSAAANKMRADGFKTIYELQGGIMKWRGENFPETTDKVSTSNGMTRQQFDALLNTNKLVLIDFYAEWCAPCKKMDPYLKEISDDMAESVIVVRINVDDNKQLCKDLKIDTLPVLQLYKNKNLVWANIGFIGKEEVLKHLH